MDALLITAGLLLCLLLAGYLPEGIGWVFGLLFFGGLLYLVVRALA